MKNYKHAKRVQSKRKTSQLKGEFKAKTRLDQLKNRFINLLMRNGEKSKASKLFEASLNELLTKSPVINNNYHEKEDSFDNGLLVNPNLLTGDRRIEKTPLYYDFLKTSTLYQAVENVKPTLELRRVRKGGTTYQVPAIVNQKRQERLAIKWIIESALKRKKKNKASFSNCLVKEIVEALNKTGQPRQRRDEQLKIAEYNRAYTRYRWW